MQDVKTIVQFASEGNEPVTKVSVSGRFRRLPGLLSGNTRFEQVYKVKDSQFSTHGYLAINNYPYCELNPESGLSSYLPLYLPSPAAPTWQFQQDNAIGGVNRAIGRNVDYEELESKNWRQLADNLVSIY